MNRKQFARDYRKRTFLDGYFWGIMLGYAMFAWGLTITDWPLHLLRISPHLYFLANLVTTVIVGVLANHVQKTLYT